MEVRIFNVYYIHHNKLTRKKNKSSVILINKHPLIWALELPERYAINHFTTIRSWTEVDRCDVLTVLAAILNQNILNVEDYRSFEQREDKCQSK